jgi:hypothetical protein
MNIIFGREHAQSLVEKYTVLELDTICTPDGNELVAFCVIENIPILQMPKLDSMKSLHENLITNYRKKDWNYCTQAMEHLIGFWNSEVDTFYNSLQDRINQYKDNDPGDNWTGIIDKRIV